MVDDINSEPNKIETEIFHTIIFKAFFSGEVENSLNNLTNCYSWSGVTKEIKVT